MLDTDGFGMKSDNLHFNGLGQQQLGNGAAGWLLDFSPFLVKPSIQIQGDGTYKLAVERPFDGFDYTLQKSTTLLLDSWQTVESVSAGSTVEFDFSMTGTREFYRVVRELTP
ncbi:MAG: hypothetical protein HKP20_07830 [Akkermansiaceae bacterium]|nr:hypothetical protein [Akkermansiaceae bacterium]